MKSVYSLLVFALLAVSVSAQEISYPEFEDNMSSFELVIEGISEVKGEVRIAVFNSEEAYGDKEEPLHAVVLEVKGDTVVWDEAKLPFGDYAIAVYHDKNVNGKLDSNFLGIPKEAYGFSNNARGKFGPASWKDAHFSIEEKQYSLSIKVD
ncbi:DUF2141 domain-containing protein [Gracilimonas sp. Q87]|uniref:DUF2141 domain-containing protein n=1 Tax=Gracilimonas sp. Q87 TaxID=3384766 RepID=UPI00398432D7